MRFLPSVVHNLLTSIFDNVQIFDALHHIKLDRRTNVLSVLACLVICGVMSGCKTAQPTFSVERPVQHTARGTGFAIHSNLPKGPTAPLVKELEQLRGEIFEQLKLPEQRDPVALYLFSDEASYRNYMQTTWPNLPPRRAYFVGTSRELAVYSFHGGSVKEDLRHEFTHGLLHACLETVPLWLDEGLAEYFEVEGAVAGAPHRGHLKTLQTARADGWNPSLYQLEQLSDFRRMSQRDYAEAWGWVHFMLQSDEASQETLLNYIAELKDQTVAAPLMPHLEKATPTYYNGLISHVSTMAQTVTLAGHRKEK